MKHTQNYILLPVSNNAITTKANKKVADFLTKLSQPSSRQASFRLNVRNMDETPEEEIHMRVLDSIKTKGAKLVKIDDSELANFRFSYPGLRVIPEQFYRPAYVRETVLTKIKKATVKVTVTIVVSDKNGNPLKGIDVIAFTDFSARKGAEGATNASGRVKLNLDATAVERIYVYPEHTYWGFLGNNLTIDSEYKIELNDIDLNFQDSLRHFYDTRNWPTITQKIRVGVIDTGVGPHEKIDVKGGNNFVLGEDPTDFADNGEGHGTHVAGIIAGGGSLPGVAHGVEIMSYRVFPKNDEASNFYIMKAIEQAIKDKCDLINMSLGQENSDEGLISSIKDAYNAGILCFAANGNDSRSPVSFPAAYSLTVALSAMGRKGTFPPSTVQTGTVQSPFGTDKQNYIADFSNVGNETDLTAPGVGIVSTFPNNLYAVMDGTSMACPAATGIAARLLASRPDLLSLPRDQVRADEFLKHLSKNIQSMGFGSTFEGKGMLFTL